MKFIPTTKEEWIEQSELPYGKDDLSKIYDCLIEEMQQSMIVLQSLGGRFDNEESEPLPLLNLNSRKYENVLEIPDHIIGGLFKKIVKDYETKLYDFDGFNEMPNIPTEDFVLRLQVQGMEFCVWQFYFFASALMNGLKGNNGEFIEQRLAAFQLAHELGVHPKEITPEKALEYLRKKK